MSLTTDKCIEGWTNSLRQLHLKADIAFFGDSLTYWGDFASLFPDKIVCNFGLRGDNILGMKSRVEQLTLVKPKIVFIQGGINDIAVSQVDLFKDEYRQLCDALIQAVPDANIIVQTLLPVNNTSFGKISCSNRIILQFNECIKGIADELMLRCLDLYPLYAKDGILPKEYSLDGIHLKQDAYNCWYEAVLQLSTEN